MSTDKSIDKSGVYVAKACAKACAKDCAKVCTLAMFPRAESTK